MSKSLKKEKNGKNGKAEAKVAPSTMISRRVCIATASLVAKNINIVNKAFSTLVDKKKSK